MPDYFPAFLDVPGRRCLVVGGGAIAARKVHGLLECGARVTVVSPSLVPELARLATMGGIDHRARAFRRADARGAMLVIAATGLAAVDDTVAEAARRHGALVNAVDRPASCDFIYGSVLRRGELQIAVSTVGPTSSSAGAATPTSRQRAPISWRRPATTRSSAVPAPSTTSARSRPSRHMAVSAVVIASRPCTGI